MVAGAIVNKPYKIQSKNPWVFERLRVVMNEVPTTEVHGTLCCKRIYLNERAVCPASTCAMSLSLHLKSCSFASLGKCFLETYTKVRVWFLVKTSSFYRCVQNWLQQIYMRFVRTIRKCIFTSTLPCSEGAAMPLLSTKTQEKRHYERSLPS